MQEDTAQLSLGKRLAQAISGLGLKTAEFCSECQINYRTVQQYITEDRTPSSEILGKIAAHSCIDINWLLTGKGRMYRDAEIPMGAVRDVPAIPYGGVERRQGDEFVYVPRIDGAFSAGPGAFLEDEQVRDRLAFRRDWIREMGLQAEELAIVSVRGDSMEPTLAAGDLVLVDLSHREIQGDGIYVIRRDGVLVVKRLQTTITGDIYIRSDNPRYSEERITKEQIEMVRLVGRVVWLGRQI